MVIEQRFRLALVAAAGFLVVAGIGLWLYGGSAKTDHGDAGAVFHQAGAYGVRVELRPEKPRIGDNRLTLLVRDPEERPVTGATVTVVAEMPAMGAMPAMRAPATVVETAPGSYRGDFELSMDGAWPLTVTIESARWGWARLQFDLTTARAGLRLVAALPPAGEVGAVAERAQEADGVVRVDARRRQAIGLTTATVERRALIHTIRAAAQIAYDETRFTDVSLKFDGWIGGLKADFVGARVEKGQVLFSVYSPDLVSAQEEYLESLHRGRLIDAARRRLSLWDLDASQIAALEQRRRPAKYLPILSPAGGIVVEKRIVEGSPVKAGTPFLRIADVSKVWVEAEVYESDLPWVHEGMEAEVRLPDLPELGFRAAVAYLYPYLKGHTRTLKLRLVLPNPQGLLRPGMYATVYLRADLGARLLAPAEAVIYSGTARYVFVDIGAGRLQPRRIETGVRSGGFIEILAGVEAGETVITSGNFLIASESRLKGGMAQW